jgi:tetratricopeptide (TPR) repeat protein
MHKSIGRSLIQVKLKQFNEALESAKKAVLLSPTHAEAFACKAICRYKLKSPLPAIQDFLKSSELGFDSSLAWLYRAKAHFVTHNLEQCVAALGRCEELLTRKKPYDCRLAYKLGKIIALSRSQAMGEAKRT